MLWSYQGWQEISKVIHTHNNPFSSSVHVLQLKTFVCFPAKKHLKVTATCPFVSPLVAQCWYPWSLQHWAWRKSLLRSFPGKSVEYRNWNSPSRHCLKCIMWLARTGSRCQQKEFERDGTHIIDSKKSQKNACQQNEAEGIITCFGFQRSTNPKWKYEQRHNSSPGRSKA